MTADRKARRQRRNSRALPLTDCEGPLTACRTASDNANAANFLRAPRASRRPPAGPRTLNHRPFASGAFAQTADRSQHCERRNCCEPSRKRRAQCAPPAVTRQGPHLPRMVAEKLGVRSLAANETAIAAIAWRLRYETGSATARCSKDRVSTTAARLCRGTARETAERSQDRCELRNRRGFLKKQCTRDCRVPATRRAPRPPCAFGKRPRGGLEE